MEQENKDNTKNREKINWTPVITFYLKTTSWIIFPLVVAILVSKEISSGYYFIFVIVAFGVTCFGIYKEIKEYKIYLAKEDAIKNKTKSK